MKTKTVWIFQTGEPTHFDGPSVRPMRAINLANELEKLGHQVVIWTAQFDHTKKCFREVTPNRYRKFNENIKYYFVPSYGYKSNISLARFIDHITLAINLRKSLKDAEGLPNIVFVGFPPIEFSYVATSFFKKREVPVVVDAKDQWPDFIIDIFKNRVVRFLFSFLLSPLDWMTRRTFQKATSFCSVTDEYLSWMLGKGGVGFKPSRVCSTSTSFGDLDFETVESAKSFWDQNGIRVDHCFRLFFVGSFMSVFDFETVAKAAQVLEDESAPVQIVICGRGHQEKKIQKLFRNLTNVKIFGWINQPQLLVLASRSKCTLIPYKNLKNYTDNVPNKVNDSLQLLCPMITPLNGVVGDLVETHGVGFSYQEGNFMSLVDTVWSLVNEDGKYLRAVKNIEIINSERENSDNNYSGLAKWLLEQDQGL